MAIEQIRPPARDLQYGPDSAISIYLDERFRSDEDWRDRATFRDAVGKGIFQLLSTSAGEDGVCATGTTGDGSPIIALLRDGVLSLIASVGSDWDSWAWTEEKPEIDRGRVVIERFGSLRGATLRQAATLDWRGDDVTVVMLELEHDRLPGGRLTFNMPHHSDPSLADELTAALSSVITD